MLKEQIMTLQMQIDDCDMDIERLEDEVREIKKNRKILNSAKKRLETLEEQLNEPTGVSI